MEADVDEGEYFMGREECLEGDGEDGDEEDEGLQFGVDDDMFVSLLACVYFEGWIVVKGRWSMALVLMEIC